MIDPRTYAVERPLLDGTVAHIRGIRADDKQRLRDAFHRLTGRSVYFRFFSGMRELSDELLAYFTEVDFRDHVALVAVEPLSEDECIVGVGRYIHTGPKRAEVALGVVDDHQSRGIGTVLLRCLVDVARESGIDCFEAEVLAENHQMLEVFAHSGFPLERSVESGVVSVTFPIEGA